MCKPTKESVDNATLIRDITERENIIRNYKIYGLLDRDDAIKKIQDLRINDKDVATVTAVNLSVSSIPFSQATNDQLVEELVMQMNILVAKLTEKQVKKDNEH